MRVEDTSIPRFKLATINKKDKYLIDLDSHKSTWLIPMSTWYVANNATKINEDQYTKLKKIPKNKTGALIWSFSWIYARWCNLCFYERIRKYIF